MSKPKKSLLKSKTTGNVFAGAAAGSGFVYMAVQLLMKLIGQDPSPEVLAAIVSILSTILIPFLSRQVARMRKAD